MTTPEPAWDVSVLARPIVLRVPVQLDGDPDPMIVVAAWAVERHLARAQAASRLLAWLAHRGVVALRTAGVVFEVRELADGWLLVHSGAEPEPRELAAAAWIRAHRLARDRAATQSPGTPDSS
ncbi:conserved hypothetical protein [Frankia canadensis]|uniref:Uncharacterized protein n=1 Tax=Frankia canadensis TaxID=1836972 RepID=A0A2I2KVM8_9ACTN|nr:hypothetical protein [Frankia canadensis]SNQ49721.1 conserved hypothetical protein [Frankia canadensis]SOU57011.1 conserved hypothetical protein [Frankia canadensis]